MLKHLGLDGWQAWDYAIARLYRQTETAEGGVTKSCDVCGSPNGKEHGGTCPIATAESLMIRELRKCQAGHRKPVVYVAGRFRSSDGWKINENVFAAEKAGRKVAALGAMPLIPHSIGAHMAGTEDDTFWLTGTLELMRRCDAVLVLPGYQESQGAMGEIAEAQRIGMPVIMPLDGAPGWEDLRSWLKLSMLAQGEGPVMLMAEIAEKRLVDARGKADQTLARLGIELGQREGETLLAAAQRVRETGIHAEVRALFAEAERDEMKEEIKQANKEASEATARQRMTEARALNYSLQAEEARRETERLRAKLASRTVEWPEPVAEHTQPAVEYVDRVGVRQGDAPLVVSPQVGDTVRLIKRPSTWNHTWGEAGEIAVVNYVLDSRLYVNRANGWKNDWPLSCVEVVKGGDK